ncbi:hypothetical protein AB0L57_22910 [Nocardia sp. NPDC052254]|uniref:hypothetical protein n=1 Tax=Nocardia sp. NPDC052254 TaxID=3155681 RepID=UPI003419DD15
MPAEVIPEADRPVCTDRDDHIVLLGAFDPRRSVRLVAPDLVTAGDRRRVLDTGPPGRHTTAPAVLLDVVAHIARDTRAARRELATARERDGAAPVRGDENICYTGTPAGLARLISDVVTTGICDGVTLVPAITDGAARASFDRLLTHEVVPVLARWAGRGGGPPMTIIRVSKESR